MSKLLAQSPPVIWSKCFGGTNNDGNDLQGSNVPSVEILTTNNNEMYVCSRTSSNDGDVSGNHGGNQDLWVSKIDSSGNIQFSRCIGGTNDEMGKIKIGLDGSLYVYGWTNSNNGDFLDNHGNADIFICKFDSLLNLIWTKCYGGSYDEFNYDYNFEEVGNSLILFSSTTSNDGDVQNFHGIPGIGFSIPRDVWVLKVNKSNGVIETSNCIGGSGDEYVRNYKINSSGFALVIATESQDGDFSTNPLVNSTYLCALDSTTILIGNYQLQNFSGNCHFTSDGGLIAIGDGQNIPGYHGGKDIGMIKYDSNYILTWQKTFGGSNDDVSGFGDIIEYNNGYLVAGTTNSNDGDFTSNHGGYDIFILKIDGFGNTQWINCYGGTDDDDYKSFSFGGGFYISSTFDTLSNGNIILGNATKSNNGDVSGNHGDFDWWIFQVDGNGNLLWQLTVGGSGGEYFGIDRSIPLNNGIIYISKSPSNDGNIIGSNGNSDIVIFKVSFAGQLLWLKCLGTPSDDYFYGDFIKSNVGFIYSTVTFAGGGNTSNYHGGADLWIVRYGNDPTATSMEEISSVTGFSVFPNPTNEQISLKVESFLIGSNYMITDILGRQIQDGCIIDENTTLSLQDLSAGTYLLTIGNELKQTIRFVKE